MRSCLLREEETHLENVSYTILFFLWDIPLLSHGNLTLIAQQLLVWHALPGWIKPTHALSTPSSAVSGETMNTGSRLKDPESWGLCCTVAVNCIGYQCQCYEPNSQLCLVCRHYAYRRRIYSKWYFKLFWLLFSVSFPKPGLHTHKLREFEIICIWPLTPGLLCG